jgi:MFS transporter, Spinster family, sphingosine-1-phosphate transporter
LTRDASLTWAIRRPRSILAVLTALNLLNYIDRFVLSAVLPRIEDELSLSHAVAGLLGTIFLVGYVLTSPVFGTLADRGRRKGLLAIGIAVWSLATIASGLARSFTELAAARAFVGVGEASYATIAPTLIDDLAPPEKKGSWLAIFYAAMPIGGALGYVTGGVVEKSHGWRAAFFVAGGPGIALAVVCLLIAEPGRQLGHLTEKRAPWLATARPLARSPLYLRAILGYAASSFAIGGFSYWAPTFLFRRYALDLAMANKGMGGVTVIAGAVGTAIGGLWSDRATKGLAKDDHDGRARAFLRICALSAAVGAPLAAAAILSPSSSWFFPLFLAGETAIFISTSPVNAVILETVPVALRATAMAMSIFTIHALGDLWSPPGVGVLLDHLSAPAAMLALPAAIALSAAGWWPSPVRRESRHEV